MAFSKSFPKTTDKTVYPRWEEIYLDAAEEKEQDSKARDDNIKLMKECINDARIIFTDCDLKDYQTDIINAAIALFEKRASHSIYYKENRAKQKFDLLHKN